VYRVEDFAERLLTGIVGITIAGSRLHRQQFHHLCPCIRRFKRLGFLPERSHDKAACKFRPLPSLQPIKILFGV